MKTSLLAAALLLASAPAAALFKVVGPDGSVTYTDRAPVATTGKVVPLGKAEGPPPSPLDGLPTDLRAAASRFPVTLYTSTPCTPCDSARQLLQQRGVPYTEKQIASQEDLTAYEKLVGSRNVPGATVGAQALVGFFADDWQSYLDAAGYPKASRLPPGWKAPAPSPVVARPAAAPAAPPAPVASPAPAAPAEPAPAAPPPPAPGGIRF